MAFVALEFNEEEYELPARDGRLDAALRNALQPVIPSPARDYYSKLRLT